jgi:hypothetical protein
VVIDRNKILTFPLSSAMFSGLRIFILGWRDTQTYPRFP